jgi:hypothetical protein
VSGYVAKSALVLGRDVDGSFVYVYQGERVPSQVTSADVARLADEGHIAEVPTVSAVPPIKKQ